MTFTLPETLQILERTPGVLNSLLRGSSPSWHRVNEGDQTWSAFDVAGHLIHGEETDWIPRAQIILKHGETRAFAPFDRFAQFARFGGWSLDDLLDRFAALRQAGLQTVRGWGLTDQQLALRGRHPELGSVTLGELLATWAVHDLNHIGQIARVMARRYSEEVGPWRAHLSILSRQDGPGGGQRMTVLRHDGFNLDDGLSVLVRTPTSLSALLSDLPERWVRATEGDGTWSPFDVIGHLANAERTAWIPRVRHILAGESRPFPPFDRTAHFADRQGKSLAELLATLSELRRESLGALAGMNVTSADLGRTGWHPEFGEVTLGQLLATWVVHDLGHLGQVVRAMAKVCGGAVGPWRAYLSILQDRK